MLVLGHGNVCVLFCEWMWLCLCVIKCVFTCVEVIMWVCLCATVSKYMSICVWEIVWMNMNMILSKCECVIMSRSQHEWFCSVCVNTHVCVYEHAGFVNKWTCSCMWNWSYMSDSCVSMLSVKCESMCMYECVWEVRGNGCKCTTLSVYKSIRICVFLWEFKWECRLVMEVTYKHALCVWECSRLSMFMYEWTSEYAHECEHEHM